MDAARALLGMHKLVLLRHIIAKTHSRQWDRTRLKLSNVEMKVLRDSTNRKPPQPIQGALDAFATYHCNLESADQMVKDVA